MSKDLGLPFIDVDRVISKKMDMSIKEIFQRFGEPYYRALETMTIKGLIEDKEKKYISLGSGLPGTGTEPEVYKTAGYCCLPERICRRA